MEHEHNCSTHYHAAAKCDCRASAIFLGAQVRRETVRVAFVTDTPMTDVLASVPTPAGSDFVNFHIQKYKEHARTLERENARLRYHLTELGKFADRAGLVLATIEAEDTTEGEQLQEIIDGISTWAAPAILGDVKGPNDRVEGRDAALSRRVPSHDGLEGNGT